MANRMWGGVFGFGPDEILEEINASIDFDRKLYAEDIAGSKAHAAMLAKQGIIGAQDARKIARGLDTILSEIKRGKFKFSRALEDIHTHVEARLGELIGPAAGRLHTAARATTRSRPISSSLYGTRSTPLTWRSPSCSGRLRKKRRDTRER